MAFLKYKATMTYRASFSPIALLLYLLLVAAWLLALHRYDSLLLLAGFGPFYGLAMVSLVKKQKYILHHEALEVNGSFSSHNLPYSSIRAVTIKQNPWWQRLLGGLPAQSVAIHHSANQQSKLHVAKARELCQLLESKLSKGKTGIREGLVE